jgi:predicted CoA-binding protein
MVKKTLILGATENPARYAHTAAHRLVQAGHSIVNVGLKAGTVAGQPILTGQPEVPGIHTITLYVGPAHQPRLYDYILKIRPERLIFNPGTENPELAALAKQHGIVTEEACTLVLLATDQY